MFSMHLLEEAGSSTGSPWVPILVLGWFLVMTIVGWQVSRRNAAGNDLPAARTTHSENHPSEFDRH
jgi:hypothetical protein